MENKRQKHLYEVIWQCSLENEIKPGILNPKFVNFNNRNPCHETHSQIWIYSYMDEQIAYALMLRCVVLCDWLSIWYTILRFIGFQAAKPNVEFENCNTLSCCRGFQVFYVIARCPFISFFRLMSCGISPNWM